MKDFGDLSFKPAQQGELDSLCGVYAATNFISRRLGLSEHCDGRWKHSKKLIEHLALRGKFTVARVCTDGFKNGQIQAAFNKLAPALKLDVVARDLGSVMRKRSAKNLHEIMLSLCVDEAVMLRVDDECHWILVHSAKNNLVTVDDSYGAPECFRVRVTSKRLREADLKNGIVFLNA